MPEHEAVKAAGVAPDVLVVVYDHDRRRYRAGDRLLSHGRKVEVKLGESWVPGVVRDSAVRPGEWVVEVPVVHDREIARALVLLSSGMLVRFQEEG